MNNGITHDFTGMTFVITGGTRGIGATTSAMAASYGANVVVSGTNADAGAEVVAKIAANGGSAAFVACDVAEADQVKDLMAAAADTFGGIDVLLNNAGIHESSLTGDLSIEELGIDVFDRVLAVNLRGPWLCSKFAVPYLKRSTRNPSIINTGSTGSLLGYPGSLAYGSSKGGLKLLTKNLAVELAPYGIRANCVCPGPTETDMVADYLAAAEDQDAARRSMTATHLVPRLGRPDDIAHLLCFLASEQACFVNGVDWLVDGGALAWRGANA
jgi:NAD(P)-dependent dehydrogenase (short-subunit alcohol dehydrogenase family)